MSLLSHNWLDVSKKLSAFFDMPGKKMVITADNFVALKSFSWKRHETRNVCYTANTWVGQDYSLNPESWKITQMHPNTIFIDSERDLNPKLQL